VLKITLIRNEKGFELRLSGQLTEEYLAELERLLRQARDISSSVHLDLSNVTLVDRAGMLFLLSARGANVTVEHCPSYVSRWIEQEGLCKEIEPRDNTLRNVERPD
jgi:ABC-type transporter Mla MlaB component